MELLQVFKKAGLSMFASEYEKYDYIGSSFVGDAIISDLFSKLEESSKKLTECGKKLKIFLNKRINEFQS